MSSSTREGVQAVTRELRRQNKELETEIFLLEDAISLLVKILGNASALKSMMQSDVQLILYVIQIMHTKVANARESGAANGAAQPQQTALISAILKAVQAQRQSPSEGYMSVFMQVLRDFQKTERCRSQEAAPPAARANSFQDNRTEWEACD